MMQTNNPKQINAPALNIISINIEGFSADKAEILSELCRSTKCDILCVQETHRNLDQPRPQIPGLTLVAELPHSKYGSAIFARPGTAVVSTSCNSTNSIETITVDTGKCTITCVYKPPNQPFKFNRTHNFSDRDSKIVIGDLNSHNIAWGYRNTNPDGLAVERWAEAESLSLIHDAKLPKSFSSCRWKRGYNPDLIFASDNISQLCTKVMCEPIPRTQHRPISCQVHAALKPAEVPFRRRFNFSKANWDSFSEDLDAKLCNTDPVPRNYDNFVNIVHQVSRRHIPRGCRPLYIPGLDPDSSKLFQYYQSMYENDAFAEETIAAGEELMLKVSENRQEKWIGMLESMDMTKNSKKAWSTLRKLTDDPAGPTNSGKVSANQVAHQLLLNGKTTKKLQRIPKPALDTTLSVEISKPFTWVDIISVIKALKNGKAAGLDDITIEQLKHMGPGAVTWLLKMFNNCLAQAKIPKIWRKAKVIALLKPGKSDTDPKNYRPISLLCHTFKLFERLLLNRLMPVIEPKLISDQAGFRPGKSSSGQILRLTQHIEDGFEAQKVTGVVFVDLSAAYDTVNINRLLAKVSTITADNGFVKILGEMLRNRRFQVHLNQDRSRWRSQKNGLPQGSVLAPALFNVYTNDQPTTELTERFLYADDLALTTQTTSFEDAELNLERALEVLARYYEDNALRPNPAKTLSCVYHLRNKDARRKLNINWQGIPINHSDGPVYLGVTLDRALTYNKHCLKTKQKISTRNNLLRRLTSTTWGATPQVLRTTGLSLCFSAGEYACPVWHRSAHAREIDIALNETLRTITGCLKPTPLNLLYPTAGIAPPGVRREIACAAEKSKQESDNRHPLFGAIPPRKRLTSRHSFLECTNPLTDVNHIEARRELWIRKKPPPDGYITPAEELPAGHKLPWPTWKSLNRLRTQVGRCRSNLSRWGYTDVSRCDCGVDPQTMSHLLTCPLCPKTCSLADLYVVTENAIEVAKFWENAV